MNGLPFPMWTSRFQAQSEIITSGLVPVAITRSRPRFRLRFNPQTIRQLAPTTRELEADDDTFEEMYLARLDAFSADRVALLLEDAFQAGGGGEGLCLLCFENVAAGELCHRRTFAEWWKRQTGQDIPELPTRQAAGGLPMRKQLRASGQIEMVSATGLLFSRKSKDRPDRGWLETVLHRLQPAYPTIVEPACGSFVISMIARSLGWPTSAVTASDIAFAPSVIGYWLAGRPLSELDIRIDGVPLELEGSADLQVATALYHQLVLRAEARVLDDAVEDLRERADRHLEDIRQAVVSQAESLRGIGYRVADLFDELEQTRDDPDALIVLSPPSRAPERFFDTGGRLTWAEPNYRDFERKIDTRHTLAMMRGRPALYLIQEQAPVGHASDPTPVYARQMSRGRYLYYLSNRPEEVMQLTGGPQVKARRGVQVKPDERPPLPHDHELDGSSVLGVEKLVPNQARFYRQQWAPRLQGGGAGYNLAVVVDGFVAGVFCYSTDPLSRAVPGIPQDMRDGVLLRYAIGAPHATYDLADLAVAVALERQTVTMALSRKGALWIAMIERVLVVEQQVPFGAARRAMQVITRRQTGRRKELTVLQAPLQDVGYEAVMQQWLASQTPEAERSVRG